LIDGLRVKHDLTGILKIKQRKKSALQKLERAGGNFVWPKKPEIIS
jgi:hypothetical protein